MVHESVSPLISEQRLLFMPTPKVGPAAWQHLLDPNFTTTAAPWNILNLGLAKFWLARLSTWLFFYCLLFHTRQIASGWHRGSRDSNHSQDSYIKKIQGAGRGQDPPGASFSLDTVESQLQRTGLSSWLC